MTSNRLMIALSIASIICIIAACAFGSTAMDFARVIAALFGQSSTGDTIVIWEIRLPRALAAYVVGASLGASGAALQGLLRNPLAEPGVLGVTATASLSATFALYYGFAASSVYLLPIYAIAGALAATALLAAAAMRIKSVVTLILLGVGLSSFSAAAMSLLLNMAPNPFSLADMINWSWASLLGRLIDEEVWETFPDLKRWVDLIEGGLDRAASAEGHVQTDEDRQRVRQGRQEWGPLHVEDRTGCRAASIPSAGICVPSYFLGWREALRPHRFG